MTPLQWVLLPAQLVLLVIIALGISRALLGPTLADRLLAVLLMGSSGVAWLLLISALLPLPALIDVALVLALLAIVVTLALVQGERNL